MRKSYVKVGDVSVVYGEPIQGETRIEYIPYQKTHTDFQESVTYEQVPKVKKVREYYQVEYITDYKEVKRMESQIEYVAKTVKDKVPVQKVEYVEKEIREKIPQYVTEYVTKEVTQ